MGETKLEMVAMVTIHTFVLREKVEYTASLGAAAVVSTSSVVCMDSWMARVGFLVSPFSLSLDRGFSWPGGVFSCESSAISGLAVSWAALRLMFAMDKSHTRAGYMIPLLPG